MTRRHVAALAGRLLVPVAALLAASGCGITLTTSSSSSSSSSSTSTDATTSTDTPTPTEIAPATSTATTVSGDTGGGTTSDSAGTHADLRLVGQGFALFTPRAGGAQRISWVGVYENPNLNASGFVALTIDVHADFLGADGGVVASDDSILPILLPGQRMAAVGSASRVSAAPAGVQLTFTVDTWRKFSTQTGSFSASPLTVGHNAAGDYTVAGSISSDFQRDQANVVVAAVLIDAGGHILGGATTVVATVKGGGTASFEATVDGGIPGATRADAYAVPGG